MSFEFLSINIHNRKIINPIKFFKDSFIADQIKRSTHIEMSVHFFNISCPIDFGDWFFELFHGLIPFPDKLIFVDEVSIFVDATISIVDRRVALSLPKFIQFSNFPFKLVLIAKVRELFFC